MFIKLLGPQVSIASANSVDLASTIRIVNTGATATLNLAYANGTIYANTTVSNTQSIVLVKNETDLVTGANMLAAPVQYRG